MGTNRTKSLALASMIASLVAFAVLACLAHRAEAASYVVHGCRLPSGAAAPTSGWSAAVNGAYIEAGDSCAVGGSLLARVEGVIAQPAGASAIWQFSAPADTEISTYTLARAAVVGSWAPYAAPTYWLARPNRSYDGANLREVCSMGNSCGSLGTEAAPLAAANVVADSPPDGTSRIYANAECSNPQGCLSQPTDAVRLRIFRSEVHLEDRFAPTVTSVSGELATASVLHGTAEVSLHGSDRGGGLYRVKVLVDGVAQAVEPFDENGGACVDAVPGGTLYEFTATVPCLLAATRTVAFDSTRFAEGSHALKVVVEDAAGLETTFVNRMVTIDNVLPPALVSGPQIAGQPEVGATLSATAGAWAGAASVTHQWLRCDAEGGDCREILDATGAQYAVRAEDAYGRLRVRADASSSEGSAAAVSDASALVRDAAGRTSPPAAGSSGGGDPSSTSGASPASPVGALAPGPNGQGASPRGRIAIVGSSSRRLRYGRRLLHRARLLDAEGRSIRDASVTVLERIAIPGRAWRPVRTLETDQRGELSWIVPAGPSRTIRYAYKASGEDRDYSFVSDLTLKVSSSATLRASHRNLRNGQRVTFDGRVVSRPIPRGGLLVNLQARSHGRWITFKSVRTRGARGVFRARYRFRATYGRVTYLFRAQVRQDSAYPYQRSQTKAVAVTVRG